MPFIGPWFLRSVCFSKNDKMLSDTNAHFRGNESTNIAISHWSFSSYVSPCLVIKSMPKHVTVSCYGKTYLPRGTPQEEFCRAKQSYFSSSQMMASATYDVGIVYAWKRYTSIGCYATALH